MNATIFARLRKGREGAEINFGWVFYNQKTVFRKEFVLQYGGNQLRVMRVSVRWIRKDDIPFLTRGLSETQCIAFISGSGFVTELVKG